MKTLLTLAFFGNIIFTHAQPLVDSAWFATCRDLTETLYVAHRASQPRDIQTLVGDGGAGVIWDFSDLQPIRFDCELNYLERDFENHTPELPFHNWLNIRNGNNELQLHLTGTTLRIVGYRFANQHQFYDDPLRIANFPLTYFSNFQDTAIYFYDDRRKRSTTYRNFLCDGYGTLILPQDTFQNVLRVKIDDETFHHTMPRGKRISQMRQITYHFWTADAFAEPLTILIQEFKEKEKSDYVLTILYNPNLKPPNQVKTIDDSNSALFDRDTAYKSYYASHHK